MDTIYAKKNNLYEVQLQPVKLRVFYVGIKNYPFYCDILTVDNKFFRCAVNFDFLAILLLAKPQDILNLSLCPVFAESSVMGLVFCKNISKSWINFGEIEFKNSCCDYFSFKMKIDDVFIEPMPYWLFNERLHRQDLYYCLLTSQAENFAAFAMHGAQLSSVISVFKGDFVTLSLSTIGDFKGFNLQNLKNESRDIANLNQVIYSL